MNVPLAMEQSLSLSILPGKVVDVDDDVDKDAGFPSVLLLW